MVKSTFLFCSTEHGRILLVTTAGRHSFASLLSLRKFLCNPQISCFVPNTCPHFFFFKVRKPKTGKFGNFPQWLVCKSKCKSAKFWSTQKMLNCVLKTWNILTFFLSFPLIPPISNCKFVPFYLSGRLTREYFENFLISKERQFRICESWKCPFPQTKEGPSL